MADNNVDLLDLNDDLPELDGSDPFAAPECRSKNIWKLAIIGVLALAVAAYVVVKLTGNNSANNSGAVIMLNPDVPEVVTPADDAAAQSVDAAQPADASDPDGLPQKVIEDRKDVEFNPDAGNIVVSKPKPLPVADKPAAKPAQKPVAKPAAPKTAAKGAWSVQVGSLSSRAAAEREQKNLQAKHSGLFSGRSFAIQSANVGGTAVYRLRVAGFATGNEANSFCSRAKTSGINCYAVPSGK